MSIDWEVSLVLTYLSGRGIYQLHGYVKIANTKQYTSWFVQFKDQDNQFICQRGFVLLLLSLNHIKYILLIIGSAIDNML